MKNSCLRPFVLATCALTLTSAAAAQSSTPQTAASPRLIVWAHTAIENNGAPTLDILDLERYVVNQLESRQIMNVSSSLTTTIPRPPVPKTYLGILSVDTMQVAERPFRNINDADYTVDGVFGVDLSLTIKDVGSGKTLGTLRGRAENRFRTWERNDIPIKRIAIYTAADRIVNSFMEAANKGEFGDDVKSLLPPSPSDLVASWVRNPAHLPLVVFAALTSAVIVIVKVVFDSSGNEYSVHVPKEDGGGRNDKKKLQDALALKLATDNFSDAACWDAAHDGQKEILDRRAVIEDAEAARLLDSKNRDTQYRRIASHAVLLCDLTEEAVIDMLRNADVWDYRVLREAELQQERSVSHA
ncbi:MAG: hypothetical protein ROO76_07265 [Terriglobia bacterium]|nr:hypothetical protein [Terriglobia bacterium]